MSNQDKEYYMVPFGATSIFHPGVEASKYPFLLAVPDQEIIQYNQLLTIAMSCDVLTFTGSNPEMGSSFEDLVSFIRSDCGFDFTSVAIIPVYRREFISKFADLMRGMDANEKEAADAVETFNNHLRSMAEKVIPFPISKQDDLPDIFYAVPFCTNDGGSHEFSHPDDLDIDFNTALVHQVIVQATPEQAALTVEQMTTFAIKYMNATDNHEFPSPEVVADIADRLRERYDSVAIVSRWAYGRLRQTSRICNQMRHHSPEVRKAVDEAFARELRCCASKVFDF
jgi:hypothetical protein